MIITSFALVLAASFFFEADAKGRTWKTNAGIFLIAAGIALFTIQIATL